MPGHRVPRTEIDVETILSPTAYPFAQLLVACGIQRALRRGLLVLTEPPWKA